MPDGYERGDTARLTLTVRDAAGVLVDPGTLTLTIRTPAGVTTVHTYPASALIVKDATGTFHADVALDAEGMWAYEWRTTTPGQVQGGRLTVRATSLDVLPWSLSLAALKRRVDHELADDDDKLRDYLAAAVLQAQAAPPNGCGRLLIPDPVNPASPVVTRTVQVSARGRALIPDASEITGVTIDDAAVTGYKTLRKDGYIVQISGLTAASLPYDAGALPEGTEAVITGRFGFTTIPENLADAIYVLAARMHYEEAAQYADQVEILEGAAVQSYYRQLPPRTKMVFGDYSVPRAIVGLR